MSKLSTQSLVRQAMIAAAYFVLTITLGQFAYGPIQFRYAEILNLLAFYNPVHAIGVTIGVFLSNIGSPLGIYDLIFGTAHTIIALIFIIKSRHLFVASLWPTIFSFIIGYEIAYLGGAGSELFAIITLQVMASEFIIMSLIAFPLFKLLEKNQRFMKAIKE